MENELLTGNVGRSMLRLTLPVVGGMCINTLFNLVDAMWVGNSGVWSLAAVNLSSFSIWIIFALVGIVSTGADSLIATKLGESVHDPKAGEDAVKIAQWSLVMAVFVGFLETACIVLWGQDLLSLTSGRAENMEGAVYIGYAYLGMMSLGFPIVCINECFSAILRAYGDTKTPLKVMGLGFCLNIAFDPIFIFGYFGVPRMGSFGAAIASVLAFFIACCVFMFLVSRKGLKFTLPSSRPKDFDYGYLKRIVQIGLPTACASMIFSFVYMAIAPVISKFGPEAMASLGVGHKMESLNYVVCSGISIACITMVGQNIGAGYMQRAKDSANLALKWAIWLNVFVSAIFLLFPNFFVSWFGDDQQMHIYAVSYLRIIALSQIAAGISSICEGIFAGGGNTFVPMCISIPCSLLRVPACYILVYTYGLGLSAVWWTFTVFTILRAVFVGAMYLKGKWIKEDKKLEAVPA